MWTPQWLSTANATQLGCSYRLEVFRTESKGWGVRSWDHIPSGGFVAEFTGTIHTLEAFRRIEEVHKGKRGCKAKRADYAFDLQVRPRGCYAPCAALLVPCAQTSEFIARGWGGGST